MTISNINNTTNSLTNNQTIQPKTFKLNATIFGKNEDTIDISFSQKSLSIKVNSGSLFQKSYDSTVNFDKFNPKETLKAMKVIGLVIEKAQLSQPDKTFFTTILNKLEHDFQSHKLKLQFSETDMISIQELQKLGIELKDIIVKSKGPVSFRNPLPGPFPESAERQIDTIIMAENNQNEFSTEYNKNMEEIARNEGFNLKIIKTKISINPEDSQIVLQNASSLAPASTEILPVLQHSYGYGAPTYYNDKKHTDYQKGMGSASDGDLTKDMNEYNQGKIKEGKSYFEGGNTLTALATDKSKVVIMGNSSFDINTALYRTKYMTYAEVAEADKFAGQSGIIEMIDRKTVNMIAQDLNIRREQLLFIPQLGLHIDTCLRPGLNGQIFIHDWGTSKQLLTELLKSPDLSPEEKNYYSAFLKHALIMEKKYAKEYKETYNKLTKYGFTVIKIPGDFYSEKTWSLPAKRINFMNGVMGTSKTGTFYITNGSNFPRLNNVVASLLKHFGINNVYFAGQSLDKFSFDPAEQSSLEFDSGVDCRTLEIPKINDDK